MYCSVCGKEVMDEAVICPSCGCAVKKETVKSNTTSSNVNKKEQNVVFKVILGLIMGAVGVLISYYLFYGI